MCLLDSKQHSVQLMHISCSPNMSRILLIIATILDIQEGLSKSTGLIIRCSMTPLHNCLNIFLNVSHCQLDSVMSTVPPNSRRQGSFENLPGRTGRCQNCPSSPIMSITARRLETAGDGTKPISGCHPPSLAEIGGLNYILGLNPMKSW